MFELSLQDMSVSSLEQAAAFYAENGFVAVTDTDVDLLPILEGVLDQELASAGLNLPDILDGTTPLYSFSQEQRKALSQIDTSDQLQSQLVTLLEPVLLSLLGPLVHVSSNFHAQFKGADLVAPPVDHGGYPSDSTFLEPFGQYLLHQDFTGARLPTSPGGMTLWVPSTTGENWGLRLYPGSHRQGILCHDWIDLDDDRLSFLGEPIDILPERGRALLFHSLILHSSVSPGPSRRVSSDIRFFPLCGYLPSPIWVLGDDPEASLAEAEHQDEILAASRYETQVYLGRETGPLDLKDHSVLNWAAYVQAMRNGESDQAISLMQRFTNVGLTGETHETYVDKYLDYPMNSETMKRAGYAIRGETKKGKPYAGRIQY